MDYFFKLTPDNNINIVGGVDESAPAGKNIWKVHGARGRPDRPRVVRGSELRFDLLWLKSCSNVIITELMFAGGENRNRILVEDCENVWIEGCTFSGGKGGPISVQSCRNVVIRKNTMRSLVANTSANGDVMNVQGVYCGETTGILIEENWVVQTRPRTTKNQGFYINGACDDVVVRRNYLSDIAHAAMQIRCGGDVYENLIENCPIGITWAYVNGEGPQKKGGCRGSVYHNVIRNNVAFERRPDGKGMLLGYGIQVGSNVLDGEVRDNLIYGDSTGFGCPIFLEVGRGAFEGDAVGIRNLRILRNIGVGYKDNTIRAAVNLRPADDNGLNEPNEVHNLVIRDNDISGVELAKLTGKPCVVSERNTPSRTIDVGALDRIALVDQILVTVGLKTRTAPPVREPTFLLETIGSGNVTLLPGDTLNTKWTKAHTMKVVGLAPGTLVEFYIKGPNGKEEKVGSQKTAPLYMWGDDLNGPLPGRDLIPGDYTIRIVLPGKEYKFNVKVPNRPFKEVALDIRAKVPAELWAEFLRVMNEHEYTPDLANLD